MNNLAGVGDACILASVDHLCEFCFILSPMRPEDTRRAWQSKNEGIGCKNVVANLCVGFTIGVVVVDEGYGIAAKAWVGCVSLVGDIPNAVVEIVAHGIVQSEVEGSRSELCATNPGCNIIFVVPIFAYRELWL